MKIREVKVFELAGHAEAGWTASESRPAAALDVYPEFHARDPKPGRDAGPAAIRSVYVEVQTDGDLSGLYGPILREQAFIIRSKLRPFLIGRDPLAGETLWDQMARLDRHARSGHMMMAISAVDCALWDLRGKHFDAPVYRLLGGPTRDRVRVYGSMGGQSQQLDRVREHARSSFDKGFTAQKWFFRHGPADGPAGVRKNLELARTLRETLGAEAELMFDSVMGWDAPFALAMARGLMDYNPVWMEEPLPANHLAGFIRIKRETGIPLAAGEHLYTRWDVKPFLDAGVLDYVQADPDWTGGITELVKICALAATHDVKVVPHGHHVLAAAHVVASQSPGLCPKAEYLLRHLERQQFFHKTILRPEDGWLPLPPGPGLGIVLAPEKIEERRELEWD